MSTTYDLFEHGLMLADRRRVAAYIEAIGRAVRPGAVVADIGSGVGVFALAACRAGARRVYAIEPTEIIQVAREAAAENGVASRIEFIEAHSGEITLPERADVLVLDVRGVLPDDQPGVVIDARRRLLQESAVVVPRSDSLWAAPIAAADLYHALVGRWDRRPDDIDLGPARDRAANSWVKCHAAAEQLAAEPKRLTTIEYATTRQSDIRGSAEWLVRREVTAHGLVVWFESVLADEATLSNRPGAPELLYGQGFFPWPEPVSLEAGDLVSVSLDGEAAGGSFDWSWHSRVTRAARSETADFRQSTRRAERSVDPSGRERVTALNEAGRADRLVLEMMASGSNVESIAHHLHLQHPSRFRTRAEALTHVGRLACLYA